MAASSNTYDRLLNSVSLRLADRMKSKLVAQIEFATVKSIEGDTCTVQMLTDKDGVTTEGIGLQVMGNCTIVPKIDTECLVAHIMNDDSEGLIIWCKEIEVMKINGDQFGGLIKKQALIEDMQKITAFIEALQQVLTTWTPVAGDGGAALKILTTSVVQMQMPTFTEIENVAVKHG